MVLQVVLKNPAAFNFFSRQFLLLFFFLPTRRRCFDGKKRLPISCRKSQVGAEEGKSIGVFVTSQTIYEISSEKFCDVSEKGKITECLPICRYPEAVKFKV